MPDASVLHLRPPAPGYPPRFTTKGPSGNQPVKVRSGKGVRGVVNSIHGEIFDLLSGLDAEDQAIIDDKLIVLDATADKSRLGANAILAVSLAIARAAAHARACRCTAISAAPRLGCSRCR